MLEIVDFNSIEDFNEYFKQNPVDGILLTIKDIKIGFTNGELKKIYVVFEW
jgi:hypothetical protein